MSAVQGENAFRVWNEMQDLLHRGFDVEFRYDKFCRTYRVTLKEFFPDTNRVSSVGAMDPSLERAWERVKAQLVGAVVAGIWGEEKVTG